MHWPAVWVGSPALRTWVIFCSSNTKKSEPSADALGLSAGGLTRTGDLADFLRSFVLGPVRMAHPQCGWLQMYPWLSKAVIWTHLNPVRMHWSAVRVSHPHSCRKMCNAIYRWVPKAQDNQLFSEVIFYRIESLLFLFHHQRIERRIPLRKLERNSQGQSCCFGRPNLRFNQNGEKGIAC